MGTLSELLGSTVYLDSNIIIYAVEGLPEYAAQIQALLEAMDSGEITSVTSDLTLAAGARQTEARSKPAAPGGLSPVSQPDPRASPSARQPADSGRRSGDPRVQQAQVARCDPSRHGGQLSLRFFSGERSDFQVGNADQRKPSGGRCAAVITERRPRYRHQRTTQLRFGMGSLRLLSQTIENLKGRTGHGWVVTIALQSPFS